MSQPCAIVTCKRASRALCHCCQQNLCILHLNEHNDILNSQLNPLADEINILSDRFKTLNTQNILVESRQKLEQWREDCYKKIDCLFQEKWQELDRLVTENLDEQREKILYTRSTVAEFIHDQEATQQDIDIMTSTVHQLQKEMNKIEQRQFFQINTHPLLIDNKLIQIKQTNEYNLDLSALSPVCGTLKNPVGSWCLLASTDRLLLMHRFPNLCLVDREMNIVKQVTWPYDRINDICWSSIIGRFIILEENNIVLIDEDKMTIRCVQIIEKRKWLSTTCSDKYLFLSTNEWGSSIMKLNLFSFKFIKQWTPPITCTTDELIDDIAHNKGKIILLIGNKLQKYLRVELRSSENLDHIWTLRLDVVCNKEIANHCYSINRDEWLLTDINAKRLLHITSDGKIKTSITYKAIPHRVNLFDSNMLAVATGVGINFHTIQSVPLLFFDCE